MTSFTTHSAGQTITSSDINLIQTAVNTVEGLQSPLHKVHGFAGWSFDPWITTNINTITMGTVYAMGMYLPQQVITNCHCYVVTAHLTTHMAMGLYKADGTLLSQTADQTSAGNSTGLKTFALGSAQSITAGYYYVTLAATGTSPQFFMAAGSNAGIFDMQTAVAGAHRIATSGTAYSTVLPSPLGTLTAASALLWVGVS